MATILAVKLISSLQTAVLLSVKKSSPKSNPKLKLPASKNTAESKSGSSGLPALPSLASAMTSLI